VYSIGKFAKEIGVTTTTLRNWHKNGELIPSKITNGGTRYYSHEQLSRYSGVFGDKNKITIGYCRVSSNKQRDDLNRQVENMKLYLNSKGNPYEIIEDIGSGINYNKKGLNKLIHMIVSHKAEKVVVLYKDRLLRFGFELIENISKLYDCKIEIIDNTEKTEEQELVEDLIQIVTVFSCRLQDKRANKAKKMIQELTSDD
jgi:putative resolvase